MTVYVKNMVVILEVGHGCPRFCAINAIYRTEVDAIERQNLLQSANDRPRAALLQEWQAGYTLV